MANHRPVHITASIVSSFLTGAKADKLIQGTYTACSSIASELAELNGLCQLDPDFDGFSGNKYTEYGNLFEADAIKRYEEIRFVEVHSKQVVITDLDNMLSCTPDGLVGPDGLIEVKTVTKCADWIGLDVADKVKQHNDQIQFQLMLSGRQWCDLVLYQPRFIEPYDIIIERITPDAEWIDFAKTRLPLCRAEINRMYESFKSRFTNEIS